MRLIYLYTYGVPATCIYANRSARHVIIVAIVAAFRLVVESLQRNGQFKCFVSRLCGKTYALHLRQPA